MVRFNTKREKYDNLYMDIACRVSLMSHAERMKVGSLIVKDRRILSMGWNGMPSGWDNRCEYEEDGDIHTRDEVLHSEANTILKMSQSTESSDGATMYSTHQCCLECAKLIHQSGIQRFVYLKDYHSDDGIDFLKRCGLKILKLDREEGYFEDFGNGSNICSV